MEELKELLSGDYFVITYKGSNNQQHVTSLLSSVDDFVDLYTLFDKDVDGLEPRGFHVVVEIKSIKEYEGASA